MFRIITDKNNPYFYPLTKNLINPKVFSMAKPLNYITEEEAMKMLGLKKYSLRILTRNEQRKTYPIRSAKLNYKTIIYSKTDIETYINSLFEKPEDKKTA